MNADVTNNNADNNGQDEFLADLSERELSLLKNLTGILRDRFQGEDKVMLEIDETIEVINKIILDSVFVKNIKPIKDINKNLKETEGE